MNAVQYRQWIEAKDQLAYWKKKESELRNKICDHFLEGQTVGSHTFERSGYKIKAVKRVTTSIDDDLLSFIWDDLTEEEQACIKFKPSLSQTEYKKCENTENLDQAITTKPAMPSLEIVPIED